MPAHKRPHTIPILWYILSDYIAALLSSMLFHFSRRIFLSETLFIHGNLLLTNRFWLGTATIPIGWLMLYAMAGSYTSLYKKSRLNELVNTFTFSIIGCTIVFFAIVINDPEKDYHYFYKTFFIFLSSHFLLTLTGRLIVLNRVRRQILQGRIFFNTLLIGSNAVATRIYKDSCKGLLSSGYRYTGYVTNDRQNNGIAK